MRRFEFGKNWQNFLRIIDEKRIQEAEVSLKNLINEDNLKGKTFVDIVCGSGIFSLSAKNLGAKVYSFDYDENAVKCAIELKNRYYKEDKNWKIEKGDILNENYIKSIGQFDIVYAWGIVHHTGNMWKAMENILFLIKEGGILIISVYNDQGFASKIWRYIKKTYNYSPIFLKYFIIFIVFIRIWDQL